MKLQVCIMSVGRGYGEVVEREFIDGGYNTLKAVLLDAGLEAYNQSRPNEALSPDDREQLKTLLRKAGL